MYKYNISELKTKLSSILSRLKVGDIVTLCNRNVPVAEIRYFGSPKRKKRPLGLFKGKIVVSENIAQPLPADVIADFGATEPLS